MGPCYTCKRTVAFGGIKDHGFRFCSKPCHARKAAFIDSLASVPVASIDAEVMKIRNGRCAKCGKAGSIEFHKSVFVWSAILITRMSESTFIGCSTCARKAQALSSAGSFLVGWWGIPFGLLFTPAALIANAYHMVRSGPRAQPSSHLKDYARERLALADKFGVPDFAAAMPHGRIEPRF
jgi:hypothetical protein